MSRVYFHSEHGEAELRGSERAYASGLCGDIFAAVMGLNGYVDDVRLRQYLALFPAGHYVRLPVGDRHRHITSIRTAMAVGEEFFLPTLSTAYTLGGDVLKLLARLHGQCEIHAYVEGEHRAWLAGIIERGRATNVLRAEMGWESVVALLRSRADGPVVTSYSVCEQFPNRHVAGWTDDRDGDGWYDLTADEQWRRAMKALRKEEFGLGMTPDHWDDFYFGDGTDAFDLLEDMKAGASLPEWPEPT